MAQQGKSGGSTGKGGGGKGGGGKGGGNKNKPNPGETSGGGGRRSTRARYKRNPRGGVLDSMIQIGVAGAGVVIVNEAINAVLPGATTKPVVMLGGGLAISHFAPNSKTGEKIDFIGKVIAVGGVVGLVTPFIRSAFQGVTSGARQLIGAGDDENVGEYFHLPEANLGEYIDMGAEANAYAY